MKPRRPPIIDHLAPIHRTAPPRMPAQTLPRAARVPIATRSQGPKKLPQPSHSIVPRGNTSPNRPASPAETLMAARSVPSLVDELAPIHRLVARRGNTSPSSPVSHAEMLAAARSVPSLVDELALIHRPVASAALRTRVSRAPVSAMSSAYSPRPIVAQTALLHEGSAAPRFKLHYKLRPGGPGSSGGSSINPSDPFTSGDPVIGVGGTPFTGGVYGFPGVGGTGTGSAGGVPRTPGDGGGGSSGNYSSPDPYGEASPG